MAGRRRKGLAPAPNWSRGEQGPFPNNYLYGGFWEASV